MTFDSMGPIFAPAEDAREAAISHFFGARSDQARRFADHLCTTAVERGLVGPREVSRMWERHILNCVCVVPLLPFGVHAVDVGSGAGLPGIAIAIARPDVVVTLVEPLQRRVIWLDEVVRELALENVTVVRARAEELSGAADFGVALARAVAPLPILAGWCLPLLQPGGALLALKGKGAAEELAAAESPLRSLGAISWSIVRCGEELLDEPATVVVVTTGDRPGVSAVKSRTSKRSRRR